MGEQPVDGQGSEFDRTEQDKAEGEREDSPRGDIEPPSDEQREVPEVGDTEAQRMQDQNRIDNIDPTQT